MQIQLGDLPAVSALARSLERVWPSVDRHRAEFQDALGSLNNWKPETPETPSYSTGQKREKKKEVNPGEMVGLPGGAKFARRACMACAGKRVPAIPVG